MSESPSSSPSDQADDYTADELDALWVSYQTQNVAFCPYCESVLLFDLTDDPEDSSETLPLVTVTCTGCGRKGSNEPSKRNDSEQNPT